ncbi:hypothetical protein [Magnetovibrio sp.]|uniref:hypothetical protein n=1 Tax=Magnetovibrio sp. TaxID=2024836 RepID=UPI002F92AFDC
MQSDILILFTRPQSDADLSRAKSALMSLDRSVLAHSKEGSTRVLLVKFDPSALTPATLLKTMHDAGFQATMAGG